MTTTKLLIPEMTASQSQKHVTFNEALFTLDTLVQLAVLDKDLSAPPGGPALGDRYIVGGSATGSWLGKESQVATYDGDGWVFFPPNNGWFCWIEDEAKIYFYQAGWSALGDVLGAGYMPLGSGGPKICQTRNTDTTTDIATPTPVEVPITGVTDIMDSSWFTIVGNGVRCLKAGRVKVSTSVLGYNVTDQRTAFSIEILVDGVVQGGKGQSSYIRASLGHETGSSSISRWVEVSVNDIITVQTTDAGLTPGTVSTTMPAGGSLLTLEQWEQS